MARVICGDWRMREAVLALAARHAVFGEGMMELLSQLKSKEDDLWLSKKYRSPPWITGRTW